MKRNQISWETWGSSMLEGEKRIEEVQSEEKRSESHSFVFDSLWSQGGTKKSCPFSGLQDLLAHTCARCYFQIPSPYPFTGPRSSYISSTVAFSSHTQAIYQRFISYWFHCYSVFRLPVENCFCKINACKSAHFSVDSHCHFRGMIPQTTKPEHVD